MPHRDIVAIGASAGGVEIVRQIVSEFPADLQATVLVTVHTRADRRGSLPELLEHAGPLPAHFAVDGEPMRHGRIYVAPPDVHLLARKTELILRRGPRENAARPAIDPLFRSVAVAFGPRAIGVVLSGNLDDGADGLRAIKRCGGITVIQDPDDAAYPSMPRSAAKRVAVDHVAPAAGLGGLIARLATEEAGLAREPPQDIVREAKIAERVEIEPVPDQVGPAPVFSCPDCGGRLALDRNKPMHFRCTVGHAHSARSLLSAQADGVERALWVALRTNQERAALLRRMASEANHDRRGNTARVWEEKAAEYEGHAELIRKLLTETDFAGVPDREDELT